MTMSIIAVHTYGSHRVKHAHTGQTVSAYKMGYSSAASKVLLMLYGDQARDVSSKQASYHYIQVDTEVTIRHGYILLKVTDDELTRAVSLTIKSHRPAVYRWMDSAWLEFPSLRSSEYTPITGRSGPDFNSTGMRIVAAATGTAEAAIAGITVEKSQRDPHEKAWFWIRGDTYPHRDVLKRWGCRWSKRQKGWYYIGWQLPDAVQQLIDAQTSEPKSVSDDGDDPCPIEEAAAILGMRVKDKAAPEQPPPDSEIAPPSIMSGDQPDIVEQPSDELDETPKVRVIKPVLGVSDSEEPDVVIAAIRQTKTASMPTVQTLSNIPSGKRGLIRIPQQPCGELTGSISGSVWCYGFALHEGVCVYVNMGGPRTAVEAMRAKLSKGDIVNCVPWDAPAVELTAGEGSTGMYSDFMQNIPEAKFTSLILLHEWITQPNYGGNSTTFLFNISDEQAMAQLRYHVTKLVKVPVFPEWTGYLWQAGQNAMLLRPTRTGGGVDLYTIIMDCDAWTRLITGGLSAGIIALPRTLAV